MSAAAEDVAEAASPPAGKSKKLILFVGAPIIALLLIVAGLYFAGMGHLIGLGSKSHGDAAGEHAEEAAPAAEHGGGHGGGHGASEKSGGGHGGKEGAADEKKAAGPNSPAFFDLPEMLVNVNAGGKRPGFLKLSVSLELENGADEPRLKAVLPRIVDNIQVYLRELRVEDLKGSSGLYRLREELLVRVNSAAAPAKIRDVLFKEMLVQ